MNDFDVKFTEFEMPEIVACLLRETGQTGDDPVEEGIISDYLKLQVVNIDFEELLSNSGNSPRGVLSYPDKIVGISTEIIGADDPRKKFTILHEIGHYVLPEHHRKSFICDHKYFSHNAYIAAEKEANEFAAEMIFKGDKFTIDANSSAVAVSTIKKLKFKYDVSFESTARRFVEKNTNPCAMAVFAAPNDEQAKKNKTGNWNKRYVVASLNFKNKFFSDLRGKVPEDVLRELGADRGLESRDIADTVDRICEVGNGLKEKHSMVFSFFTNHHSVFALIQPEKS